MASNSLTDIKIGRIVKINNAPCLVVWSQFNRKQQRKPVMRTKLKNLITGGTIEHTFLSGESFDFAEIENRRSQYLYRDTDSGYFMDNQTFDQFTLPLDQIEGALQYIKDDTEVYVTFYEDKPISVQPPVKVEMKVKETPPGVKGDTATGGTKPATLETGAVVDVPLFITEGETIIINTETGEYVGRIS
jgi:elongation factor P